MGQAHAAQLHGFFAPSFCGQLEHPHFGDPQRERLQGASGPGNGGVYRGTIAGGQKSVSLLPRREPLGHQAPKQRVVAEGVF